MMINMDYGFDKTILPVILIHVSFFGFHFPEFSTGRNGKRSVFITHGSIQIQHSQLHDPIH